MNSITSRERELVEETIKAFVANQWVLTPEGIWGFLQDHGEPVDINKIAHIMQQQQAEGMRR
jgi:hypothetical protein